MNEAKTLTWQRVNTIAIVKFIALIALATIAPLLGHNQFITGPLVNATLFLAVIWLSGRDAVLVGLVPSLIALSVGLLPAVLAPMVPFIMVSNALLIVIFSLLYKKSFFVAVIAASILKFLFLFATSNIVINLLMKKEVAAKVAAMMSWPQLVTALIGGVLVFFIARKWLQNRVWEK